MSTVCGKLGVGRKERESSFNVKCSRAHVSDKIRCGAWR